MVDYSGDGSISLILLPLNTLSLLLWLPEYFWYKVWMISVKVTTICFNILAILIPLVSTFGTRFG